VPGECEHSSSKSRGFLCGPCRYVISRTVSGVSWVELEDCCGSVFVSCCCEQLVAEVRDSSGTQRKGNVRSWKPLSSNGSEDVTVDTGVCKTVNCEVLPRAVSKSAINLISPNPVCSHTHTRDNIYMCVCVCVCVCVCQQEIKPRVSVTYTVQKKSLETRLYTYTGYT
jgi:hypothetical protein